MNNSSRQIFQLRKPLSPLVLEPLKAVAQTANSLGFRYFLAGATARDLILENVFGRPPGRLTRDLDFGFALSDWKQFESLKAALMATGRFEATRAVQRVSYLYAPDIKVNVDLIPFGGLQDGSTISWPPQNDFVMNVAGFCDALESAMHVRIDTDLGIPVASLPGLIILKLFAWLDRKHERRDAPDILKILSEYADAGNEERLYADEIQLLEAADFDISAAGAQLLGKDARRISGAGRGSTGFENISSGFGICETLRACCQPEVDSMRKELEQRLVERWPTWFNTGGDIRCTAMPRGFEHDDGWFDILWRLCEDLEPMVAEFEVAGGPKFEVLQVKEKFGGLRFYVNCRRNEAIRQRIGIATDESFHTCEVCGQPGKLREEHSIKTLCDEHDGAKGKRTTWLS